ncbi:MAG TPA: hypothetical protein VKU00_02335 [Chthonomonadaceae bacterium]|nr:hypothetical protein [Chthonomonadaceae bacterium]
MLRTPLLIGIGAAIVATGILVVLVPRLTHNDNILTVQAITPTSTVHLDEPQAGLCPWRNPREDAKVFFPTATAYREETLILSRQRIEVGKLLGRTPTGEENALKIFRILQGETPIGAVVPRRIRSESGVIELVVAVGNDGRVVGAKLQRLREPDAVAEVLQSPAWLNAFHGASSASAWKLGQDFPAVSAAARPSAEAILDGARTALILLDVGNRAPKGTSLNDPVRLP